MGFATLSPSYACWRITLRSSALRLLNNRCEKLSNWNKGAPGFGGAALFSLDHFHKVQTPGKNLREIKPLHANNASASATSECKQAVAAETAIAYEQPPGPLRLAIDFPGKCEQIRLSNPFVLPFRL